MKREIKFRAYDTITEYMFVQGTPGLETIQSFFFHIPKNAHLMQWTGLLDKNGKEIYEGDILRNTKCKDQLVEVYWEGNVIQRDDWIDWGGFYFRKIKVDEDMTYAVYQKQIEVIGSIYDNPELLD